MKPLDRPTQVTVYALIKLNQDPGIEPYFQMMAGGDVTKQRGPGFYLSKEEAQAQQLVLALKNIRAEIYELEWTL